MKLILIAFLTLMPQSNILNKTSLKITHKKNYEPSGSTEMAHKNSAPQFFFAIAVVHS